MNLSGILVVVPPAHIETTVAELNALPGVEVHYREEATGRLIAVQEAESVEGEIEGLKRIQGLPNIILAELVYHYLGENEDAAALPTN